MKQATRILTASVLLWAYLAAPASAGGSTEEVLEFRHFYDNAAEEIVVLVGHRAEGFCENRFAVTTMRVFERNDGSVSWRTRKTRGVEVYVYQFAGPAPALIDEVCAALFDGDASTTPLEPWAEGTGRYRARADDVRGDSMAGARARNAINGIVTAADGGSWRVRASANLEFDELGRPIGSPEDFQSASVYEVRRAKG